ncbi:hypothetical protein H4Q26_007927 [Puccinia striiformis f. sp. tritici PST-130]|nr:hypothetical protein H4Q26_007927 [Puccinia striiformis f. sp. tritici PST-130]
MVVIYDSNSRRPQLTIHLQRRDSTSEHLPRPGLYIIIALIFLILASLLLVVILQFQSRRIDERLEASSNDTDATASNPIDNPQLLPNLYSSSQREAEMTERKKKARINPTFSGLPPTLCIKY